MTHTWSELALAFVVALVLFGVPAALVWWVLGRQLLRELAGKIRRFRRRRQQSMLRELRETDEWEGVQEELTSLRGLAAERQDKIEGLRSDLAAARVEALRHKDAAERLQRVLDDVRECSDARAGKASELRKEVDRLRADLGAAYRVKLMMPKVCDGCSGHVLAENHRLCACGPEVRAVHAQLATDGRTIDRSLACFNTRCRERDA